MIRSLAVRLLKVVLVLGLAFLTVVVVQSARTSRRAEPNRLAVQGQVGDFALVERDGRTITGSDLMGRVWIADFIFTRCGSTCPTMTAEMSELASNFAREPQIRFVSFTVDPEHDTPEVLASYAKAHGAGASWLFLTGPQGLIYRLARSSFHLGVEEAVAATTGSSAAGSEPGSESEPGAAEPFIHSTRFVLVDRLGRIRGYYDSTDPARVRQLRADALTLLRESSPPPA
jgi:cytochrome oxidase Cu insertion factor (SCO1/SenC/PrrC family)